MRIRHFLVPLQPPFLPKPPKSLTWTTHWLPSRFPGFTFPLYCLFLTQHLNIPFQMEVKSHLISAQKLPIASHLIHSKIQSCYRRISATGGSPFLWCHSSSCSSNTTCPLLPRSFCIDLPSVRMLFSRSPPISLPNLHHASGVIALLRLSLTNPPKITTPSPPSLPATFTLHFYFLLLSVIQYIY